MNDTAGSRITAPNEDTARDMFADIVSQNKSPFYREVVRATNLTDLATALAGKDAEDIVLAEAAEKGRRFVDEVIKAIAAFGNVTDQDDLSALRLWLLEAVLTLKTGSLGGFLAADVRAGVLVTLGKQYIC